TFILLIVVGIAGGFVAGYFVRVAHHEKSVGLSRGENTRIIGDGKKEAEEKKREVVFEAKQENLGLRKDFDNDMRERRQVVINLEEKVSQRENSLNNRSQLLDKREENLNSKEQKLDERKEQLEIQYSKVEELVKEQETKLIDISGLTKEQAKD